LAIAPRLVPLLALAGVLFGLVANAARAAGFDPARGEVTLDGAAFSLSFDDIASIEATGIYGYNLVTGTPIDSATLAARVHRERGLAIEGAGALGLGGDVQWASLPLTGWPDLVGRRVEVRLWQKPRGTRLTPSFSWYAGIGRFQDGATYLGAVTFQPTGTVTSDGWEEWTSGPFDFAWGDVIAPASLDFMDEAVMAAYGGGNLDDESRALLDALTVADLGPALVPAARCSLVTEAATCGSEGLCHQGRCVDAAIRGGQPILDPALRSDYIDRRLFEVDTFEGGRVPQSRVELVRAALLPLKERASAATFWPSFSEAYDLLIDGHASAPLASYPLYQNAGVCLHEGEADLLPGRPIVPLVFQAGENEIAAQLEPGDALVLVDGLPVDAWIEAAGRLLGHPGDPAGRSVVIAPDVFAAALDTGATVTFHRCRETPLAGGPCAVEDIELIELDLGALVGDALLRDEPLIGYGDIAECDYRFVRPVPSNARSNTDYAFAGHRDEDGVRTLVINGVPSRYGDGGRQWFSTIDSALASAPPLLILDERTGRGGSVDAVDLLTAGLLAPDDLHALDFLPFTEDDPLPPSRDAIVRCSTDAQSYLGCGNGFRWTVGDVAETTIGVAASSKLAILIASDVSGNDYVTKMLRRRSGETRVFGAGATWGAFGVIWGMASHLGELSGGSLQVQDTIFVATPDDPSTDFSTSFGERPDAVVRQKQSDAIDGIDTVLEAARAWLQGGAP
jgi:hypothetical protein